MKIDLETFEVSGVPETIIPEGLFLFDSAKLSPAGDKIVFSGGPMKRTNLYTINPDSTNMRRLTNDRFRNISAGFGPDGNSILFVSNQSGNYDSWEIGIDGGRLRQLTEGWATFTPPIRRPVTGDYLISRANEEQWYTIPPTSNKTPLEEVSAMPKVNKETGDWMLPFACTSEGAHVVGVVYQARVIAAETPIAIAIGVFNFDTQNYKVLPISIVQDGLRYSISLAPDNTHAILTDKYQIRAVNLESGQIISLLSLQNHGTYLSTVTADGYLYYAATRDERNIWLSEIDDVPMQTTDN